MVKLLTIITRVMVTYKHFLLTNLLHKIFSQPFLMLIIMLEDYLNQMKKKGLELTPSYY